MAKFEYLYISKRRFLDMVRRDLGWGWKSGPIGSARRRKILEENEQAITECLNDLGEKGWEIVNAIPVAVLCLGFGGSVGSNRSRGTCPM